MKIKKKIEEAFANMDKYETSLNEFHQTIWDDLKFPIENVMNERMLKTHNIYINFNYYFFCL